MELPNSLHHFSQVAAHTQLSNNETGFGQRNLDGHDGLAYLMFRLCMRMIMRQDWLIVQNENARQAHSYSLF